MDISLYYDVEMIVRMGSISEAAKELHVSQPALSRRITSLENELGLKLFERTSPLQLTPAGEIFLEYACRINAEQYKLTRHMQRLRTTPVSVIRVAGLYSKKVGPVVRKLKNHLENETLFIDIKQESNLYEEPTFTLLKNGKLQVSIEPFCPDLDLEGLDSTPLIREDIYGLLLKSNPYAEKGFFDASDLPKIRFIYTRSGRSYAYYRHLRWLCSANGLEADTPRSIFTSNAVTERDLFLSGFGDYIMMCPQSMGEMLLTMAGPDFALIPFKGRHSQYDMRAFYSEKADAQILRFVEAIRAELVRQDEQTKI